MIEKNITGLQEDYMLTENYMMQRITCLTGLQRIPAMQIITGLNNGDVENYRLEGEL